MTSWYIWSSFQHQMQLLFLFIYVENNTGTKWLQFHRVKWCLLGAHENQEWVSKSIITTPIFLAYMVGIIPCTGGIRSWVSRARGTRLVKFYIKSPPKVLHYHRCRIYCLPLKSRNKLLSGITVSTLPITFLHHNYLKAVVMDYIFISPYLINPFHIFWRRKITKVSILFKYSNYSSYILRKRKIKIDDPKGLYRLVTNFDCWFKQHNNQQWSCIE